MSASGRALLTEIIDYAGLFPPAQLPLDQAIRNYAEYRQESDSWMLARFVCPAARLQELTPFLTAGAPLALSVLGKGGSTTKEFLQGMMEDLEAILAFRHAHGSQVSVASYEARLPLDLLAADKEDDLRAAVHGPGAVLAQAGGPAPAAFYELPSAPHWLEKLPILTGALQQDPQLVTGLKLRCGGLDAASFPPAQDVAAAIGACCRARVPMKFTAGLHHPIRHFNASVQTHMHGFINVFVAGVLAHARNLSEEQIRWIIEDEDAASFGFDDAGLRWQDHRTTTEAIINARQFVTSFGSCSFDEPRAGLRTLGWLP